MFEAENSVGELKFEVTAVKTDFSSSGKWVQEYHLKVQTKTWNERNLNGRLGELENRFQKLGTQIETISGEKETDWRYTVTILVAEQWFSEVKDYFLQKGKLHSLWKL